MGIPGPRLRSIRSALTYGRKSKQSVSSGRLAPVRDRPRMNEERCEICRRPTIEWLLRMTVEDRAGFAQTAYICATCGIKLRLASEKTRDLQIDPWVREAVARVLKGKE